MNQETTEKLENMENDPETKKMIEELQEFILPKFQELQEKITNGNPGVFNMMKIVREFTSNLQKEYKEKYGRSLDEDMKKTNDKMGFSQMDLLNIFKNNAL